MKRILSLVLAMVMLMTAAAFAEQSVVYQDEQDPKVVTTVNEAGETIVAKIFNAQGEVIAEVKDDGTVSLMDVHDRTELESEIVVTRLTDAYENLMDYVHHSKVECLLHEHDIKVDIDDVLASLNYDIDAHYLVMHELFYIMSSEEIAALLVDGNYMEMTLELDAAKGQPLITMFSPNGSEWQVIPTTAEGESSFTVRLTEPGMMALLNDGRELMDIGESVQKVESEIPGETGTELANFTPSVSGKSAPEMVTFTDENGESYVGYIRSNNDAVEEILVPDTNYVITTSVAERDQVADILTHEHLEWSYDSIVEAADVGDLMSDSHEGNIASDLDAALQAMNLDLTHDQLVVKDLFEVTAYGDYLHYLYDEDYYLEVTFDANLEAGKPMIAIHSPDSVHWHVHPIEDAVMNEDGTVTLKMYDLGAVAFLVEAEDDVNVETAVQSPN